MNQILKSTPVDREAQWNSKQILECKIDLEGIIVSVNEAFEEVSEYENNELVGQPYDVLKHPEMPILIYKLLWENIKNQRKFFCIVKNLAKSGKYLLVFS